MKRFMLPIVLLFPVITLVLWLYIGWRAGGKRTLSSPAEMNSSVTNKTP